MKKYRSLLIVVLIISFGMNIYLGIMRNRDEYRVGQKSYKNAEIINARNSKNLDILNSAIKGQKITNSELLNLYINYKTIDESLIELIDDYAYYKENTGFNFNRKDANHLKVLENDVYGRITIYLENILLNIMNTKKNELALEGKSLDDFKVLEKLASTTNERYVEFKDSKLKGLEGEEKQNEFIKNKYWINIIDELNNINSNYNDYEFVSEVKVPKIN